MTTNHAGRQGPLAAPERLMVEIETARALSGALSGDDVAWVYLLRDPGESGIYITRFGPEAETTMPNDPRAEMILVAGFMDGKCIRTADPNVVALEVGQCRLCGGDLRARAFGLECDDCGAIIF